MSHYRLKIARSDFERLRALVLADMPKEAGAFALAGVSQHSVSTDILIRRPIEIPRQHFSVQHEYRLEVSAQATNGLIALCERNGLGAVVCHSHPGDIPYSPSDDHGEERIFDTLRGFVPPTAPTASLLFWPDGVRGRVWLPGSRGPVPLEEIVVLGRHIETISSKGFGSLAGICKMFDRQVRAFGKAGQTAIASTKVAIVGVGGTGSPTAEQLVRLGVNDLVLIVGT